MALTDVAVRKAKPVASAKRLYDERGLYLEITPAGAKYWRLKYRYGGKEKRLALGVYPEISLAQARLGADQARTLLRGGKDPSAERKADKRRRALSSANTFQAIADEWLAQRRSGMAAKTITKAEWHIVLAADLADIPVCDITPQLVLGVLRGIEANGRKDTAHRVKQRIGQVMRYAVAHGKAERDPTQDLRGALAPVESKGRAAIIDPAEVGTLLRAIQGYNGQPTTATALKLAPMLFARPGNLRAMEWSELDLDAAEWRIPAVKMKMREGHLIPLPRQAIELLRELEPLTGRFRYVFPSLRTSGRPMSDNTLNAALRRLGFDKETMTAHGFRAMASTLLNELGWPPDVIERALAHVERNKVRAAYNRASFMEERRRMVQSWADHLDVLRRNERVVSIRRNAKR